MERRGDEGREEGGGEGRGGVGGGEGEKRDYMPLKLAIVCLAI